MKRKITVVATATASLMVAAVAFAAWTANGTGSGYAAAGSASPLGTSVVAASTESLLYPGGTADVKITIKNANPYPVKVTSIANDNVTDPAPVIKTSDATELCDAATGVTFTNQSSTDGWLLPARTNVTTPSETTLTLLAAASMANTSHTSCQGKTFIIPVKLAGESNAS